MVSESETKNRLAVAFFVVMTLIACSFVWRVQTQALAAVSVRIGNDDSQITSYTQIIQNKRELTGEYRLLSRRYLAHQATIAALETSFTALLAGVCRSDRVDFVGVNYGDVDGSAPPPPAPRVDQSGQAIATPPPDLSQPSDVTDLSANHAGDPKTDWPQIPAALFTRVPATITLKGDWRHLVTAIADIPRRNMLIVVSNPEIKRLDTNSLTLSFEAQVLAPAVTVITK